MLIFLNDDDEPSTYSPSDLENLPEFRFVSPTSSSSTKTDTSSPISTCTSKDNINHSTQIIPEATGELNESVCVICQYNFDNGDIIATLPCAALHNFHSGCIKKWLTMKNQCPLCKEEI